MLGAYIRNDPWTRLRLGHIKRLVQPKRGESIIDLGCAAGAISHFCSTFGANVLGVDLSKRAIDVAKKAFTQKNLSFAVKSVSKLSGVRDNSFDKAVSADLVEHISQEDYEKMCAEAFRVLKKGGTVSIYTPNPLHLIEKLKKYNFILKQNPSHFGLKTMAEITGTLERHGFKIELAYLARSHFLVWNLLEAILIHIPWFGQFFGYRICVRARK